MMSVALRTPSPVTDPLSKKEIAIAPKPRSKNFSPRPYIIAGYIVVFLAFGVFGAWALIAPLASGVVATGTVSVESERKTIQHLEGGIVSDIIAKEGDIVNPGDVVLKLDPTQALGNYTFLTTRLALLEATDARLAAESTDVPQINFPADLKNSTDPVIKRAMALQQKIFDNRTQTRDGQVSILNDRISQTQQAVEAMTQQISAVDKQIASLADEVSRLTQGQANGAVAINQLSQVTRAQFDMQGNHGQIEAQIAQLRQTISETKLQIASTNQQFVERAGGELRDNSDQLNETSEKVRLAKDVLDRTTVRAPVRGMLQNIRVHTKGGVIQPAQPVMDIIPLDENLVVTAKVLPIDIENVKVGMKAEVTFSSFSNRTAPAMFGKITVLSQDVIEPTQVGQVPYYQARIEVNDDSIPADIRSALLPGMPADVIISTGERTFAQYVIKPLAETFHKSMREK